MKKIIVILSISLTLLLAGALYGNRVQSNQKEAVLLEEAYLAQFPDQMPDVILHPMTGFPVY